MLTEQDLKLVHKQVVDSMRERVLALANSPSLQGYVAATGPDLTEVTDPEYFDQMCDQEARDGNFLTALIYEYLGEALQEKIDAGAG